MDIDLLSKMVKELILDNERVVLPGLGSFVAEIVPATFSDKGYTINPPYRKLYFRSKPDVGSELIAFYAKSNTVSEEIAEKVIVDFIAELKAILFHKKTVIFPGLGRLRATKENNVFFVADEELDIYPEGFGLEPISLKTHQASASEVKAAVSDLKAILTDPEVAVGEVVAESEVGEVTVIEEAEVVEADTVETVEPEVELPMAELLEEETVEDELPIAALVEEPQAEPENEIIEEPQVEQEQEAVEDSEEVTEEDAVEEKEEAVPVAPAAKKPIWKTVLKVLIWLVATLVVLTAAYVAVSHLYPEWIDQFLYTPEELEILNYRYE